MIDKMSGFVFSQYLTLEYFFLLYLVQSLRGLYFRAGI
ncbi:putative membrane protein [Anaplasma phagocytophilum str. ApMUC09]|uniref:Putative membrane protein n=1 Tax=Anaplasma phagocytophilum str. ApMUC09 TaxID=1359152 RepID=A0A0F3N8D2_ANAPH|nr:putative membrane protein [Anaplasma phagocytophilum str. ApMUC09]